MEKASIILPTYNRKKKLKRAVDSILYQSYAEFELIIADDASTDGTEEFLKSYQDARIRYIRLPSNQGAAAARNYGLQQAQSEYIAFEDSDDVWRPRKLEKQMQLLTHAEKQVGFIYHKIAYDMGDNRYAILPSEEIGLEKKSGDIYAQMLYDNLIPCPSILATRDCVAATGGFDTQLKALEDYDFALKMARQYHGIFLDEILLDAEYSTSGVSGNAVNYLLASCMLVQRYKEDYLRTGMFDHRIEIILRDSQAIGMQEQFVALLEKLLQ